MSKQILLPALFFAMIGMAFAFTAKKETARLQTSAIKKGDVGIVFFEADWNKAVAAAKKQKKMIFIDAYTSWCGPCRMLKQKTFTDKAAGEFFNKHFINVALDMEKGDGIAFGQKYQIAAYPTLLIMDADEKSVSMSEGYINPGQLIEFGKYVINKMPKIN